MSILRGMKRRWREHPMVAAAVVTIFALGAVLGIAALRLLATDDQIASPIATSGALAEGNRLFRNGQIEDAIEAYRQGISPRPHPILAYNLGVGHHRLGQLPDAILWYRRARAAAPHRSDPWLAENLAAARQALSSSSHPPTGLIGWLVLHSTATQGLAAGLVWVAALWSWIVRFRGQDLTLRAATAEAEAEETRLDASKPTRPRISAWSMPIAVACLGAAVYLAALAAERWGPHPAVLLADCGELPAGSEVWLDLIGDRWRVAGTELECAAEAAGLI